MITSREPGEVVRLEGVDLPPNAEFHYIHNGDIRLRVMLARPDGREPRGSILFQPGRTEFIEKFFETVTDLVARGFVVIVLDPRGQGLSDRLLEPPLKSWVRSFEDYADDLAFVGRVFKDDLPRPHIVMGHSMGGTIGLQAVLTGKISPSACVFLAPMLELQDMPTPFMGWAVRLLAAIGFKYYDLPFQSQRNGIPVPFRDNKLTTDEERYRIWATYFEKHKRLRVGKPTFGWIAEALKAMKFIRTNAEHLSIPALLVSCGGDPIVTPQSIEEFAHKAGADYLNIPGCLHEILLEQDQYRNMFWAKFDEFLDKYGL